MEEPTIIADDKVKNLIIQILSKEWPLTAKQIYFKIKKQGKSVSYQAVFKALNYLLNQKILEKEKYNYSLSKEWLINTTEFYEDIKRSYLGEYKNLTAMILKKPSLTLTFKTTYKYLVALGEVAPKVTFLTKKDNYTAFGEFNQLPWPFAVGEREDKLIKNVFSSYKNMYVLCKDNNIANKLIYNYYKNFNKNIYVKFDKDCAPVCDIMVVGNIFCQVFYTKSFKDSMNKAYSKLKNLDEISLNEIYKNLFSKETKITVIITRNPTLAKIQKEKILKAFKKL